MSDYTYLTRPVAWFNVVWDTSPQGQFQFDLAEIAIGQAGTRYAPTASHIVTGYKVQFLLGDPVAISTFEKFFDDCQGRLTGFWIRCPFAECKILEVKAPTSGGTKEFWIRDAKLRDGVDEQTHLAFVKDGDAPVFGMVESVTLDAGREFVTLDAGLPVMLDTTWRVFRLLYVRFGDDKLSIESEVENVGTAEITLIELPGEYAAVETGQTPVFLYEFGITGLGTWRYTSLNASITSQSQAFTTWPIEHEGHSQTIDGGDTSLRIKTVYDAGSPVAKLFPYPTPAPMTVKIWETTYSTPDTRTLLFTGYATSASLEGNTASIECQTVIAALGAQFPRFFIQARCNYCLFSTHCAGTDGPQKADYKVVGVVTEIGGRNVKIGSLNPGSAIYSTHTSYPKDYFTFGYIEHTTTGVVDSIRTIESSLRYYDGSLYITLTVKPDAVWAVGDTVWLYPGCDGTRETCASKFNNSDRFGGHNLSGTNLSVTAIDVPSNTGNKK